MKRKMLALLLAAALLCLCVEAGAVPIVYEKTITYNGETLTLTKTHAVPFLEDDFSCMEMHDSYDGNGRRLSYMAVMIGGKNITVTSYGQPVTGMCLILTSSETVTFRDLNIDLSHTGQAAADATGQVWVHEGLAAVKVPELALMPKIDATIILEGDNVLKGGASRAALELGGRASLNLKNGAAGVGSLTAEGGWGGAGIGGRDAMANGMYKTEASVEGITIDGVCVIATAGDTGSVIQSGPSAGASISSGAGIGGGAQGDGAKITITGGAKVIATGKGGGAGIGGGLGGCAKGITIEGNATVTATGHYGGAGIGNGVDCSKKTGLIKIAESTSVTAISKGGGAGIGGGAGSASGQIQISGGTVTAKSEAVLEGRYSLSGGAGIGGGVLRAGSDSIHRETGPIYIYGNAVVTATGNNGGAGIGSGSHAYLEGADANGKVTPPSPNSATVDIREAAIVVANGDAGGAGIGGGKYGLVGAGGILIKGEREGNGKSPTVRASPSRKRRIFLMLMQNMLNLRCFKPKTAIICRYPPRFPAILA